MHGQLYLQSCLLEAGPAEVKLPEADFSRESGFTSDQVQPGQYKGQAALPQRVPSACRSSSAGRGGRGPGGIEGLSCSRAYLGDGQVKKMKLLSHPAKASVQVQSRSCMKLNHPSPTSLIHTNTGAAWQWWPGGWPITAAGTQHG